MSGAADIAMISCRWQSDPALRAAGISLGLFVTLETREDIVRALGLLARRGAVRRLVLVGHGGPGYLGLTSVVAPEIALDIATIALVQHHIAPKMADGSAVHLVGCRTGAAAEGMDLGFLLRVTLAHALGAPWQPGAEGAGLDRPSRDVTLTTTRDDVAARDWSAAGLRPSSPRDAMSTLRLGRLHGALDPLASGAGDVAAVDGSGAGVGVAGLGVVGGFDLAGALCDGALGAAGELPALLADALQRALGVALARQRAAPARRAEVRMCCVLPKSWRGAGTAASSRPGVAAIELWGRDAITHLRVALGRWQATFGVAAPGPDSTAPATR